MKVLSLSFLFLMGAKLTQTEAARGRFAEPDLQLRRHKQRALMMGKDGGGGSPEGGEASVSGAGSGGGGEEGGPNNGGGGGGTGGGPDSYDPSDPDNLYGYDGANYVNDFGSQWSDFRGYPPAPGEEDP